MTTVTNSIVFSRTSYRAAKNFLSDARVVKISSSPSLTETVYEKNGIQYQERESHLEFPYDDYCVKIMGRSNI